MSEFVAKIGNDNYATLQSAVDAAPESLTTIQMVADTKENVIIPKEKNIILDLNGYTLSGGSDYEPEHKDKAAILNNGSIIIKDTSNEKTGMVKRDDNDTKDSYYVIYNQGTMTIESGTVYNNSGYSDPEKKGGSSLICNGDEPDPDTVYEPDYAKLYIKGGKLHQDNFIAVKNGSKGYIEMTNGKIVSTNESAIQNWANAKVNGGTINGLVWAFAYDACGDSNTELGGDLVVNGKIWAQNYSEEGTKSANINIDGGKYNLNSNGKPGPELIAKAGGGIVIENGNFNIDPTPYMKDANVVRDANGNFVVEKKNVVIALKPKYPTRKAAERILFNEDDMLTICDIKTNRKIDALLNTSYVAIVVDNKYYPVDVSNFEEQYNLANNGEALTVDEDPKFGIPKINTFVTASMSNNAIKVTPNADIYCGIIRAEFNEVKDFTRLGIDEVNENGNWLCFKFDLAKATETGYSELKFYNSGKTIVDGDNYINVDNNDFVGIGGKLTVKDGDTSETVDIVEIFDRLF